MDKTFIKNSICLVKIAVGLAAAYLWAMPTGPNGHRIQSFSSHRQNDAGTDSLVQKKEKKNPEITFSLPANPSRRCIDSVFRQAVIAYGNEKWEEALRYFDTLAVRKAARSYYSRSHLMAALCCIELQKYSKAADFIKKAMPGYTTISDHLRFILAGIRMSQKEYTKALYSYEKILENYPNSNLLPRALLGSMRCRLNLGRAWAVRKTIDSLKDSLEQLDYRFSGFKKDLHWIKACCYRDIKWHKSEAAVLTKLLLDGSAIQMHQQCRARLEELATKNIRYVPSDKNAFKSYIVQLRGIQEYPRVIKLAGERRRENTVGAGGPFDCWLTFNQAYAFYRLQQYGIADSLFQTVIRKSSDKKMLRKCRWYIARSRLRAGATDDAIAAFRHIAESFDNPKYAHRAPHEIIWAYCHDRKYDKALETLNEFREILSRKRSQMKWMEAWIYYLNEDYEKALPLFRHMKKYYSYRRAARYWSARCLHKLGRNDEARGVYEQLAENDWFIWHRLAASHQLIAMDMTETPKIQTPVKINSWWFSSTPDIYFGLQDESVSSASETSPVIQTASAGPVCRKA
ncbi:MAG: tetratricopeptide repeat protein, partial [Chitinivibrionales bacterium]|nr:tetratricopeptide repeat protein [Chitinivibrionales bacterium]